MSAKIKTNEQLFKDLFKELNPIEVAILRERILTIFDITLDDIEKNPGNWKNPFISPEIIFKLNESIQKHLAFKD